MKKLLIAMLFAASNSLFAAPFVISDSTTQTVTHCGLYLDAASPVDVPITTTPSGPICKFNIGGVSTGVHTVAATFINIDPVWGRSESVKSSPFTFIRPSSTIADAPVGLVITP